MRAVMVDFGGRGDEEAPDAAPLQRTRSRDSLFLMAKLRIGESQAVHEVRVRNLSEGGLMAEYARILAEGTPVRLELRGLGEVSGKVAWCTDGRVGIAFDRAIDPMKARKPVGGRRAAAPGL